jgi:DNA-binding MurR/RpiR family transcriptional regulator
VRFAKSFGFDGASAMQRLFRDGLLSGHAALAYSERVRNFSRAVDRSGASGGADLLSEFVEGHQLALQNLPQTVSDAELSAAVKLVEAADAVFVVGVRRAFPISSYLSYSLQQAGKRTIFVDGVGGLARQQVSMVTPKDLLIAVSYQPYADETVQAVETAAARGARVLSISDSLVSPIAKPATVTLQVREAEIRAFRSLSASMCLAQALVIGFAFETSRKEEARARRRRN